MTHNGSDIAAPDAGGRLPLRLRAHRGARPSRRRRRPEAGADVTLIAVDQMADADWDTLDSADGIVFGTATYMGNVSAAFQAFAEQTGRRCLNGTWRDKVAAGFTNSGAKSGDK